MSKFGHIERAVLVRRKRTEWHMVPVKTWRARLAEWALKEDISTLEQRLEKEYYEDFRTKAQQFVNDRLASYEQQLDHEILKLVEIARPQIVAHEFNPNDPPDAPLETNTIKKNYGFEVRIPKRLVVRKPETLPSESTPKLAKDSDVQLWNPQCPDPNCIDGYIIYFPFGRSRCPNPVHATPAAEERCTHSDCYTWEKNGDLKWVGCRHPSRHQPEPTAESAERITEILTRNFTAFAGGVDLMGQAVLELQALLATAKAEAYKEGLEQNGAYFHQREQAKAEGRREVLMEFNATEGIQAARREGAEQFAEKLKATVDRDFYPDIVNTISVSKVTRILKGDTPDD